MKKLLFFILFVLNVFVVQGQNTKWRGYFSFNQIKDISTTNTNIIAATENAFFNREISSNNSKTVTTVDGLSGQTISQIHYSAGFKKTILGHTDGLLIVVNDDGSVLNIVDILNKPSIPSQFKKINHFNEHNGKLYISTDFAISVLNLANNEFGDTYFIGTNGANAAVKQTAILNNTIYAAVKDLGILKADLTNSNLIDFNQWTNVAPGSWLAIEKLNNEFACINSSGVLYKMFNDTLTSISTLAQLPEDIRYNDNYLNITTNNYIYLFDINFSFLAFITGLPQITNTYSCSIVKDNKLYIGTTENGLISTDVASQTNINFLSPAGPITNKIFNVHATSDELWTIYGDYNATFNPYPLDYKPISKFDKDGNWILYPYDNLFGAKSITRVTSHPDNENQVFFSSYYSGLLQFDNNIPSTIYNASNSSMTTIAGQVPDDIRTTEVAFDNQKNMWVANCLVQNNLHVRRTNGQWQAYNLSCFSIPDALSFSRLIVDKNNTKWMGTNFGGLIGFNEQYNKCIRIDENPGEGNLPISTVLAVAVDNNERMWIGTTQGLRVVQNTNQFLTQNQIESSAIIILEEGLAQELLFQKSISDIVVDGANNKWIATLGAGAFYINEDGQKTYAIYTKENSPLPSNMVTDIEINKKTGEVFFVTDSGMVSVQGTATSGAENLENVVVFPNPVRPNFTGQVAVTGLMDKCNVKITDISGNLVHEAVAKGGTVLWDTTAFGKHKVSSGVYLVLIAAEDGKETQTRKIMIVR